MIKRQTFLQKLHKNLLILCLSAGCLALSAAPAFSSCNGVTPKCSAATNSESQGGCSPNKTSSGSLVGSASQQVRASCIDSLTSGGCFDSTPASYVGSYNREGKRSSTRNHYGSDLGTGKRTNVLAYAATDGAIMGCPISTGGGRTTVIRHTKHCDGAAKEGKYYSTVYRHLFKQTRCNGEVRKGDTIGVVGGSNSSSRSGPVCDNPLQAKNCSHYYAIHLHLEVVNSAMSASSTYVGGSQTMQSSCGNLQALCGGCPANTNSCRGGMSASSDGNSATGSEVNVGGANSGNGDVNGEETADGSGVSSCVLSDYLDKQTCTTCMIFKTIFNAASNLAQTAISKLAAPSKNLVLIGFLIWLAIYILKQISSFQGSSPGDLLKGIFLQGARVAIVVYILSGALYQVMDITLTPVMQTGLTFANMLNPNSNCDSSAEYMQGIVGYDTGAGMQDTSQGGLPRNLGQSIVCTIKNLEDSVGVLLALGNYSTCYAFHDKALWDGIIPHLGYFLSGIGLWLAGAFLLFAFPWCLIDCILQLCIAAAMIPCSIAAFAFKSTAKYLGLIWNFFMNAMFNLVFLAVLLFILTSMFKEWIGLTDESLSSFDPVLLITAFKEDGLAWWGIGAFKIFAFIFLFVCFIDEVPSMANKFATGIDFGRKGIGRMVGGTVAQTAAAVGKGAGHIAKRGAESVGEATNSLAGNWVRSKKNQIKGLALVAFGGRKLRDANGNVVGYQARFKGIPGFTQTRTVTKDADGVWTQTKETHQKTVADKAFKPMTDANGETTFAVRTGGKGVFAKYEQMNKSVQADGTIKYTSKDGKNVLVTDQNGTIIKYKRAKDTDMVTEKHKGSVQTVNDAFMTKRTMVDADGQVIGSDVQFKNVTSKYLINKDGSTNMHAYNQIMKGVSAQNRTDAMAEMAVMHLKARGQNLDNRFQGRNVKMNKDGSFTIQQINNDGSRQEVRAAMVNGQMVISNKIIDDKGNITLQKSNGVQSKTTTYTKQADGTFTKSVKYSFTDEAHSRSRISPPLDGNGAWGYGMDPQKAMAGFNQKEFMEHLDQINNDKIKDKTVSDVVKLVETNLQDLPELADKQNGADLMNQLLQTQNANRETPEMSLKDLADIQAAINDAAANGLTETPGQIMAQTIIKKELQDIINDPTQIQKMTAKDRQYAAMLADSYVKDQNGSRDAELDKLLKDIMAKMTNAKKAELLMTANVSKEMAAALVI